MKKGFTLIELMVVVAILGVLITMGWMSWHSQINKAQDAKRKDDLSRLSIAFEDYFSDAGCYPAADILKNCADPNNKDLAPYLENIPCDPVTRTPYCYITDTANPTCFKTFKILAHFDYKADPTIADLGCDGGQFCGYETECIGAVGGVGYNFGMSSSNVTVANPVMPSPSPSPSVSLSPSPSPLSSPHPGGGQYIYACDQNGWCNSWDHFPSGCYFFKSNNCDEVCIGPSTPSQYKCIE